MTITINDGISIDSGVTITSEPIAPAGGTKFDSLYVGPYINLINNNTTAYNFAPGTSSVLTNTVLTEVSKVMISFVMDIYGGGGASDNFVGVGNISTTLTDYLGANANSVGLAAYGTYFVNGSATVTGLPTWQANGDIIDLAVDTLHNYLWIRVNGGVWNNHLTDNPSEDTGGLALPVGLTIPALTIYGESNASQFTIAPTSAYPIPDGYTFLGS